MAQKLWLNIGSYAIQKFLPVSSNLPVLSLFVVAFGILRYHKIIPPQEA